MIQVLKIKKHDMFNMNWKTEKPTRPGKYKMKDANGEKTIIVERHGKGLAFKEKGQNILYTFNGTDNCQFAKCN